MSDEAKRQRRQASCSLATAIATSSCQVSRTKTMLSTRPKPPPPRPPRPPPPPPPKCPPLILKGAPIGCQDDFDVLEDGAPSTCASEGPVELVYARPKEEAHSRKAHGASPMRSRNHLLGVVYAPHEKSAEAAAATEFKIGEDMRRRLIVRADD